MPRFVLGLGGNHRDRLHFIRQALRALRGPASPVRVLKTSPLYASDAMLPEGAPESWNQEFLNLGCLIETELAPPALLTWVKNLERKLGRQPAERWAPREIDIDLLAADSGPFQNTELSLPHPGLSQRPFALLPFADLAPEWHVQNRISGQLLTAEDAAALWRFSELAKVPFRTRRSPLQITELVGILNLTPDSFSDGGRYFDTDRALAQARRLVADGASVLDIGAESTRPGATPISTDEEWSRLEPILNALTASPLSGIELSVDTRNAVTAERALALGVHWINDVSGGQDRALQDCVARSSARYVFMHHLGIPSDREHTLPTHQDPVEAILTWAESRLEEFARLGISTERLIFDPGLGFGKTPAQHAYILQKISAFNRLGVPILVGHSRKSFLKNLPHATETRDIETMAVSLNLARAGVDYLRVHEVAGQRAALEATSLLLGPN